MNDSVTEKLLKGAIYVLVGSLCATLGLLFLGTLTLIGCVLSVALGIYQLHTGTIDFRVAIFRIIVFTVIAVLTIVFFDHLDVMFGVMLIALGLLSLLGLNDVASRINENANLDEVTAVVFTAIGVCMIIWADTQFLVTVIGGTALTVVGLVHIDRAFHQPV